MELLISKEQVESNKDLFIDLLKRGVSRENSMVDALIKKLESTDFFYAPCTTQYYNSCYGGLCAHSLDVFFNLLELVSSKYNVPLNALMQKAIPQTLSEEEQEKQEKIESSFEFKSLFEQCVIVGLLHDICKMNRFEVTSKNVKVYSQSGRNQDSMGRYDWQTVESYQYKNVKDRFIYGSDGETSEFMVRQYIPLKLEESVAIINCMGDVESNHNQGLGLAAIYNKYPLATMLHCADLLACYVDEQTK